MIMPLIKFLAFEIVGVDVRQRVLLYLEASAMEHVDGADRVPAHTGFKS